MTLAARDFAPALRKPSSAPLPVTDDALGAFTWHGLEWAGGHLAYKLFLPANMPKRAPLLVMLHGCGQDPDDFAAGTRMNRLAAARGVAVAYPAQSRAANAGGCWNWFRAKHQRRGDGEPGFIVALVRHLLDEARFDERRVYVAGLSAGGAMAASLARLYPDLFAAAGIHSGVPAGAGGSLPAAMRAMREGAAGAGSIDVPLIVFHGEADKAVSPANGRALATQAAAAASRAAAAYTVFAAPGGRPCIRTVHRDARPFGRVLCEHWALEGLGHAWSGGDPRGGHADPSGVDASREMLRFFLERKRRR